MYLKGSDDVYCKTLLTKLERYISSPLRKGHKDNNCFYLFPHLGQLFVHLAAVIKGSLAVLRGVLRSNIRLL